MTPSISKLTRVAARGLHSARAARAARPGVIAPAALHPLPRPAQPGCHAAAPRRCLSQSAVSRGITPDNKPSKQAVETPVTRTPAALTTNEYHAVANDYLDRLLSRLEELQDTREDIDVEFSDGVLTLRLGPDVGTYVINKQPPSKQIWWSSPVSGPKRYDYVVLGESQYEKQDTAVGDWVYLRDGSTLNDIILEEIGVDLTSNDSELGN
ncbi:hypothetical protein VTJ83DRAFT_6889 [Remersonia thermophila]|uniref:ferroxidase n=1 Tax=Remersonia thermophila TaxID=72144 RepID=A0ABR4D6X4_9PEZI